MVKDWSDEYATLGQAVHTWVTRRVARGEITALTGERYLRDLAEFATYVGEDARLDQVTYQDFEGWLTTTRQRTGRPYRPGSLNTKAAPVRSFFAWCHQRSMIPTDPTADTATAKVPIRPPKRLTREAVAKIIAAASFMERTQIMLAVNLGLRLGELARLDCADYDRENRLLTVHGKGSKVRILPVEGEALEALEAWLEHGVRAISGPMWPNPRTGRPMARTWIGKKITMAGERAGVACSPHKLRHTCASELVQNGVDLAVVQAVLGHASLTSTTVYVSAAPEHLRASLAAQDGYERRLALQVPPQPVTAAG